MEQTLLGFPYGAAHASEIQYLFAPSNVAYPATLTPAQQELAAVMKGDWTNLAKFGTPGLGWPRFTSGDPQWQSLVPPRPVPETDFAAEHHCAFWAAAGLRPASGSPRPAWTTGVSFDVASAQDSAGQKNPNRMTLIRPAATQ